MSDFPKKMDLSLRLTGLSISSEPDRPLPTLLSDNLVTSLSDPDKKLIMALVHKLVESYFYRRNSI